MPDTALIVIDVQHAFDIWEAEGRRRNNPDAVARIADLLGGFRAQGLPVFHVRHASTDPQSRFRPSDPGYTVKAEARERDGETVIVKQVNSAFIGTDLEARLRASGLTRLVICGATTNHCVETTTRMAGNLGFDATLVQDATWTFDRIGPDGTLHRAADIQAMTLSNLYEEFATIRSTAEVLASIGRPA
ncbi:MAG: cysteine hydrolase [Caulobacteraceae bacterium]|nr:cysteine hydrolase [Caulobacter sp.]